MGKIVIFNQGVSQQLPGFRFDEEFNSSDCPVSISNYRNNLVEFGMNNGSTGSTGISLYDRAQDLANDFLITYDSNFHDWVSFNYEGFTTVQLIQRGISSGLDPDQPIPDWYYYLPRDAQGVPLPGPSEQIARTVADFLNKPYNPTDPITWREAYDALIDVHDYTVEQIKSLIPNIKIDNWWKHSPNIIPLGENGWYQHPPQTSQQSDTILFGVDSLSKSAVAAANLINGAQCYVVNDNEDPFSSLGNDYPSNSKNESEWGTIDSAEYPLGSFAARAHAIAFEQAVNAIPLSNQVDLITPQTYNNLTVRSLEDHVHYPDASQIPGSPDLVCVSRGKYAERSEYKEALKLQIRQTWLSSVKHHGDAATIGTELAMDSFLPGNPGIGHAMSHDDYIELRVQPCLDPVTQEEVDLYDLPQYWAGNVLIPDYWTMWNATYFFVSEVPFTNQQDEFGNPVASGNYTLEDIENSRDNLIHRFGKENAPTIDWQQGSDWHQHVCYGLEQFSLERCEHIKETLERARIENISKKSTWETILGYLNNISKYCNLENVNGCTSQNPVSEIHSYPDSLHTVVSSSTGKVFFDPLSRPSTQNSSTDLALQAGGSYLLYIYQQQVRLPSTDPNGFGDPNIDLDYTVPKINDLIANAEYPPTHVVLNFEAGFTSAILRLGRGNDTDADLNARQNMVNLMTRVKAENPGIMFAYYQIPGHRSDYLANESIYTIVNNLNDDFTVNIEGESITKTGQEWLDDRLEERWLANGPIIEVSDFLAPSAYDKYPFDEFGSTTLGNPNNTDASDTVLLSRRQTNDSWGLDQHVALRKDLIMAMCKDMRQRMGRPTMPIIPFVNHYYQPQGNVTEPGDYFMPLYIDLNDYIEKQVKPFIDGGATSIITWGADQFFGGVPFDPSRPINTQDAFLNSNDPYREMAVLEFPEIFQIQTPVDRIYDWREVEWYPNNQPNEQLRDDLRIAMRDKRLVYIQAASNFITAYFEGSTDQTPLDAIQCVDTLELKVPSSPYTSTSFYDNFLENITTQAYTQDCPFTYTKIYNSNGNVFYDTIPQVEGDSSSDDMAQTAGVERYLILYQANVGHGFNAGNIINVQAVADQVDQAIAGAQEGITHACLDFENPFYADLNKLRLDPNDPDGLQARQSLVDLVTECKSRHPNLKWGYYGFPNQRSNFIANRTVGDLATIYANDPVIFNGVTKTGLEWIQDRIEERYATDGPIIEACDYMSPAGYDRYPPIAYPGSTTRGNPSNADLSDEELLEVTYDLSSNPQTQKWTSEENQYHLRYSLLMGMCKYYREQLNRPNMPVYAFVTMHYEKTATPPHPDRRWVPRLIPKQEFLNNQVKPYMDGEADGLMYWTAYPFRIDQSFDPVNYPLEENEQYTKFRDQYRESYVLDYPQVFNLTDPDNLAWKDVDWGNTTIKDDLYREVRDKQIEYFADSSNLVRTYGTASLNKNFLLGYATQYGFDNRQGHCGEGFINTFPCFDDYVGNITATVVDLTYHNTPTGYLSTITPKGLQIEQYAKIIAENPRLRVYQGVYVWNHRFSYWFGGTCGFIDGTCLDNTDQTCSPCFIKMHPYDEINSSYLCNGNLLSPPACSPQLECPPFTEGVVNWKFLLNTNCYNAKEFVREEDGNVKALFITYSNIQNSDYDILYNQISAKPTNNDWFPLCEPCPGTCTITVKFKTYVIPDQLIVFFDNDGDGLYAEQTDSADELILDTGFISTENDFDEYTFVFSDNPETDYEYDIKDICKLQFCVIGNDDPDTAWNIEISGCHFDPTFVASGSSGGFCTMLYTTPDNESERPIISSDGVPSGFVVYPSDDEYDSDNPNPYNQQIITCYQCNSGNCDSVSVQVDTGQTCEDYGLYTDSSTCNEECAADGDGSDSSPPP